METCQIKLLLNIENNLLIQGASYFLITNQEIYLSTLSLEIKFTCFEATFLRHMSTLDSICSILCECGCLNFEIIIQYRETQSETELNSI